MTTNARSIRCREGKHANVPEPPRGMTYTLGAGCAGYAGTLPCVCPCHKRNAWEGTRKT